MTDTIHNTGNPVPSVHPKDRDDNSITLDIVINKAVNTTITRTGKSIYTLHYLNSRIVAADGQISTIVSTVQTKANTAIAQIDAIASDAQAQMEETAAELGADLNNKLYDTAAQMDADPQTRDAVLGFVEKDPDPTKDGFYVWSETSSRWVRASEQMVLESQMARRLEPIEAALLRSRAAAPSKATVTDRSSGTAIRVLAEGETDAEVTKIGNSGESAQTVDTARRRITDYLDRAIGRTLSFIGQGVLSSVHSFQHWDIFGDLAFRSGYKSNVELAVSGDGVRVGALESVGAENNSVFRHRSGRLMSKSEHGIYTGDLQYIGSDFISPNRDADVPKIVFAEDSPDRVNRLIQGCASIAWVNGRIWAAFFGDSLTGTESMTNFEVIKYSDDRGETWVEWAYWVQNPAVARMNTAYLQLDKSGNLWVFSGTDHVFSSRSDNQLGCWAFSIKDPNSDKPTASSMWRASSFGYPGFVNQIDERFIMPLQIQENMTQIQDRKGVSLYEFDPTCRAMTRVGRLPLIGVSDWPEASIVQLRSGRMMAIFRSSAGQRVCYAEPGDFNNWSAPALLSTVIGPNPGSRACLRRTPKGNLILAFNSSTGRQNMTLALLNDDGTAVLKTKLLQAEFTSYPDIAFDDSGNILVVWDYSRSIERKIVLGTISEADFVENGESAVLRTNYIDDKKAI